jgi:hypothetical protein
MESTGTVVGTYKYAEGGFYDKKNQNMKWCGPSYLYSFTISLKFTNANAIIK